MAYKVGDRVEWIENVQELKVGTISRANDGGIAEAYYNIKSDDKDYYVPLSKITQNFPVETKYKLGDLVRFSFARKIHSGIIIDSNDRKWGYKVRQGDYEIMCKGGLFLIDGDSIVSKLGDVWSCIEELEYDFKPCKCCEKKYIPMGDNRPGSITEVDKNGQPICKNFKE
jgi:hypothetical protein